MPNRLVRATRLTVAGCALLVAPLSVSTVAHAKTKKSSSSSARKLPGAPAWTRGEQTYLRAGYAVETPVVAKVPHGTKVFVWGKYNGWYRVETSGHKFGWVRNELLNCPKTDKIAYLKPSKARIASARSARQRLYGSPQEVREHQAKYGVGVQAHKPKLAATVTPKARIAARPVIITPKARPVVASRVVKPSAAKSRVATTHSAPRPSVVSMHQVRWERGEVALSPSRPSRTTELQNAPTERPAFATERKEGALASAPVTSATPVVAVPNAPVTNAPVTNAPVTNAPVDVTRVDSAPVVHAPIAVKAVAVKAAPVKAVAVKTVVAKKVPVKAIAKAPIKAAPAKVVAAKAAPRLTASQQRARKRRVASDARRNALRARLGTPRMVTPPVVANAVRPISPSELLRAREEFLAEQRKDQGSGQGSAQANTGDNNGRPESMSSTDSPEQSRVAPLLQRSNFEFQAPLVQDVDYNTTDSNLTVAPLAPLALNGDANAAHWLALAKKAPKAAAPNRGGSPRDFANGRGPSAKKALGQAFADQALTYRGTPYHYGASSPNSGFDCSGLIYYTLRQRGYNPPRTAAGLASYGKPVKRSELQSGDIVLFSNTYKRGVSHVGIYVGNNNFVHAPNSNSRVRVDSLGSAYYSKKYYSARRAG